MLATARIGIDAPSLSFNFRPEAPEVLDALRPHPASRNQSSTLSREHLADTLEALYSGRPMPAILASITGTREGERLQSRHDELAPHFEMLSRDPQSVLGALIGSEIRNPVRIEHRGSAIVATLEGYDYGRFAMARLGMPAGYASLGTTLYWDTLPPSLRGALILVNRGDGRFGERTPEEVSETARHELSHSVFNLLFARAPYITTSALIDTLAESGSALGMDRIVEVFTQVRLGLEERARSEIIAYGGAGRFDNALVDLGADAWNTHRYELDTFLAMSGHYAYGEAQAIRAELRFTEALYGERCREYQAHARRIFATTSPGVAEAVLFDQGFDVPSPASSSPCRADRPADIVMAM